MSPAVWKVCYKCPILSSLHDFYLFFVFLILPPVCVCVCVCKHIGHQYVKDNFWELALSFHMGPFERITLKLPSLVASTFTH